MKTTFRRRFSQDGAQRKRFIIVLSAIVLGVLVFSFARSPIISLVRPFWQGENAITRGLSNLGGFLKSKDALIAENQKLKERLESHDALLLSYRTLKDAEERLLSSFGRTERGGGIAAGVLAHPPKTPYDLLIIDAGSEDGVEIGGKVSLPEGGALGTISEVYEHEAKVSLYSGSGIETSAYLERNEIAVVLKGVGGGTFEARLPRDVAVEPGDKILLSGLSPELLGVVREVTLEPTDSAKRVIIGGVANINGLRFVIVRER